MGPVLAGMQDEHPRVRYAALACVGQMTEDFGDWDGASGEGETDDEGSFQGAFHSQVRILRNSREINYGTLWKYGRYSIQQWCVVGPAE